MLKNIPSIISPELLKILAEMGHSDTIVLADGNFPSESMGKSSKVVRADGHGIPELLDAVLELFPLDTYVKKPVSLMAVMDGDTVETPIWDIYTDIIIKHGGKREQIGEIERFAFYEKSKEAYAIVATGEKALYANIILQKGTI